MSVLGQYADRRPTLLLVLLAPLALTATASTAAKPKPELPLPGTDQVRARLAGVASLYRDRALRFACTETIDYRSPRSHDRRVHDYVFVYDEDGKLADKRIANKRSGAVYLLDLPNFILRAYSWAFLFEPHNPLELRVVRRERVMRRPALLLRFAPRPGWPDDQEAWFGRAWVDSETFQLLRVEARGLEDERRWAELEELRDEPAGARGEVGLFRVTDVVAEFGVLRHGMRFPSRVELTRSDHAVGDRGGQRRVTTQPIYTVTQEYDAYQFFHVMTREQIHARVFGVDSDPKP